MCRSTLLSTACLLGAVGLLLVLPLSGQAAESSSILDLSTLKRNARQGSAPDQFILGRKLLQESQGHADSKSTLKWLKRSAEQGYPPALLTLAEVYEQGRKVDQDFIQAHRWYALAAEQGIVAAQDKLAPLQGIDPGQECVLFQIPVHRASRFILRYALHKRGAQLLKTTVHGFCDRFQSSELVEGTDQLQACYTQEQQIAQLTYRFPDPPNGPDNGYLGIFEHLEAKYGPAGTSSDQNAQLFTWHCHHVRIKFWLQPRTKTAFLRYLIPEKTARFQQRLKAEQSSEATAPEDNF